MKNRLLLSFFVIVLLVACEAKSTPTPLVMETPIETLAPTPTSPPAQPVWIPISIPEPDGGGYQVVYWDNGLYLTTTGGGEPILLDGDIADNDLAPPWVRSWVWSPDGSKIAYNLIETRKTILLNLENGRKFEFNLYEPAPDQGYGAHLEWHPDGKTLVAMTPGGQIHFIDSETGAVSGPFDTPSFLTELNNGFRLSPDGRTIVFLVFSEDRPNGSWHFHSLLTDDQGDLQGVGELVSVLDSEQMVESYEWLPGREQLLVDVVTWENDIVTPHLFVMNVDGTGQVELFSEPGIIIEQELGPWAISPDGSRVAFRAMDLNNQADNKIYVVNTDGSGLTEITTSAYPVGKYPEWSPDGQKILFMVGGTGINAAILCNPDGTEKVVLPISSNAEFFRFRPVPALSSNTSPPSITTGRAQITPENAIQLTLLRRISGHSGIVRALAFSPDGSHLVSGAYDDPIRVWDPATGASRLSLIAHSDGVSSLAFSPDGSLLASGGFDKAVIFWDPRDGSLVSTLRQHSDAVNAVAFSPDGKQLASTGLDNTLRLWNTENYQQSSSLDLPGIGWDVDYSYNGLQLVTTSPIQAWDPLHAQLLYSTQTGSTRIALSPIEDLAASEGIDCIALWRPSTGAFLDACLPATYNSGMPAGLVFSPDGSLLASISDSGLVQLWNVQGGNLLITYPGELPQYSYATIAFSPDGSLIAFSCAGGDICLWGLP